MRTLRNNTENNNRVNNTNAAATEQPRASRRNGQPRENPSNAYAALTDEQKKAGEGLMYIMERVTNRDGVKWLELDKKSDPNNIIIKAVDSLDDKVRKQATWAISTSARAIGGKYDAANFRYTFSRDEFSKVVGYYKLAKAVGVTTLKADTKPEPKPVDEKPEQKPATPRKDMITKADALARCKKALAIALTKDMIACMEDELKSLFA